MNPYLDIAQTGKTDWWRYLLALAFILFMWMIVGSLPLLIMIAMTMLDGNPATTFNIYGLVGVDPLVNFITLISTFLPFFIATPLAIRFIHGRPMRSIVTPYQRINWARLFTGFGVWFTLSALISLAEALLHPGRYVLTESFAKIIPFAITTLLLIPFQTSAEELAFRGYLLQWAGLKFQSRLALSLLSGLLFALPHITNPEVKVDFWASMAFYFSFGMFAAWVTLKDNGLELALGMHAANNIYTGIVANYVVSALPTPSVFTIIEMDAIYNLIAPLLGMLAFYFILFYIWKRNDSCEDLKPAQG
jgi:uncharacterized protein